MTTSLSSNRQNGTQATTSLEREESSFDFIRPFDSLELDYLEPISSGSSKTAFLKELYDGLTSKKLEHLISPLAKKIYEGGGLRLSPPQRKKGQSSQSL